MTVRIVRIVELPSGLPALRAESVAEGYGHLVRLESDWRDGTNRFDGDGEALFGATAGDRLVGIGGLNREPHSTEPGLGRLRRLYVSPAQRRSGLGRRLVEEALRIAAGHFTAVCLRTHDSRAAAFYEAQGFVPVSSASATHRLEMPPFDGR